MSEQEEATTERLRGTVKLFSGRGYGFITPEPEEDSPDSGVFFHITQVENRETLEQGQVVSYELAPGREKGQQQAVKIERVEES